MTDVNLSIELSEQTIDLLDQLVSKGIYGSTREKIAGRFIDQALQKYIEPPRLRLPGQLLKGANDKCPESKSVATKAATSKSGS